MSYSTVQHTGCCDPFDPVPWQDREISWKDKPFVKDHITSFLHIPLDMGKKVVRNMALIEKAGARAPQQMMLTDEKSRWGADIYIEVSGDVPGAKMATLSGTFLTRVFEGPYKNAGLWAGEMKAYVQGRGKALKQLYFCYTTCPSCAKAYGKNYVVLFARID